MRLIKREKQLIPISRLVNLLIVIGLFVLIGAIPLRIAIALNQVATPQAILVLGGDSDRMKFAAKFWKAYPKLDIWVSDYQSNFVINNSFFQGASIPKQRVNYDSCPTDTVTNFTCIVNILTARNTVHIYLITSDYHMARAKSIATLVLGSRGIVVTPVAVPSRGRKSESLLRIIRDCIRSLLWIVTGRSGASLNPRISSQNCSHLFIDGFCLY